MKNQPEKTSSETEYLLQCGLEPETIEGLKRSQAAYKRMGVDMTLLRVAYFEIENFSEPNDGESEEDE